MREHRSEDRVVTLSNKPKAVAACLANMEVAASDTDGGYFRTLDDQHSATYIPGNGTLFVSFERAEEVASTDDQLAFSAHMATAHGWATLTILAEAQTWFRAGSVYSYFDELIDDCFFEDFDQVIFYGAGTSGYAACAYSVASPGATVIAISPQATLDPRYAGWDDRFPTARRVDFTSRYGYAPSMCEAAGEVHIFFDPSVHLDACHAAQFNQPHMRLHRVRHYGQNPTQMMAKQGELQALMASLAKGEFRDHHIAQALRSRRNNSAYLRRLLGILTEKDRPYLSALLCQNVATRNGHAPRFQKRLVQLRQQLESEGRHFPELKTAS